jgi:hypothetical protein
MVNQTANKNQMPSLSSLFHHFDMFGYQFKLQFNGISSYQTSVGGFFSILINSLVLWQVYTRMDWMINYGKDLITENDASIDFTELGEISLDRLGIQIPYYGFSTLQNIPKYDEENCKGDCFEYLTSNMKMSWTAVNKKT